MSTKAAALMFRVVAIAEAFSWAGLLIAMFFKYVIELGEGGVPTLGMVHGVLFVGYVVTSLVVFRALEWRVKTLGLALVSGILPFTSAVFESWALRTGKLDGPDVTAQGGVGLATSGPAHV